MNFDLQQHTVFMTLSGSHAYGLATPESDYDYRGIAIPPLFDYLVQKFEQCVDSEKDKHVYKNFSPDIFIEDPRITPDAEEPDVQVFELSKFIRLAAQCNPSVIEILFTDPECYRIKHPIMDCLIENRDMFLSKMAKARFCGYALSQLKRIRRHKHWLDNPILVKPTRADFGLPERGLLSQDQMGAAEALIQKELDEFMIEQTHVPEDIRVELQASMGKMMRAVWSSVYPDKQYPVGIGEKYESTEDALFWGAAKDQEFSENFLEVLSREKRYRAAMREWKSYNHWLENRNLKRAAIEKRFKFDTKHAMHLVRLLKLSREILETGKVNVKRHDAEELMAIRNGAWTYEQIVEFAEREDVELDEVVKKSNLPRVPDMKKINELTYNMIIEFNRINN